GTTARGPHGHWAQGLGAHDRWVQGPTVRGPPVRGRRSADAPAARAGGGGVVRRRTTCGEVGRYPQVVASYGASSVVMTSPAVTATVAVPAGNAVARDANDW